MDRVVLDPLAFHLDGSELLGALRVREGSRQIDEVTRLCAEAQALGRPKAIYRLAYIEERGPDFVVVEKIRFTSRILRVNLEKPQRVFAYLCTAGSELADWAQAQRDILAQYWADAICEAVLHSARRSLDQHLKQLFAIDGMSAMNPGSLPDWPLREQRALFALLGETQESIGVTLTESLLMTPAKTVSGILFPTEETFASCQLCQRDGCPNRRAPYDPELLTRRYAESSAP